MCYGNVDAKVLEHEVQDRMRAADVAIQTTAEQGLPPELMGGLRGAFARLQHLFARQIRGWIAQ